MSAFMRSGSPAVLPDTDAMERRQLEQQMLILQTSIAFLFCVGAYSGLFGVDGAVRAWTVTWIASYHVLHAGYVIRYRVRGQPVRLIEAITPLFDVASISAAWVAVGDANGPLWAMYLYALVGYARRYDGYQYGAIAGFIVANMTLGRMLISTNANESAVDGTLITMAALTGAMAVLSSAIGSAWRGAERKARRLAETDPLTGIANRRTFLERMDHYSRHTDQVFSVLMLDLDDFKRLNDEYGHLYGDEVLVDVARILSRNVRPHDRVARYGGEEFVIAMPGASLPDAVIVAERLRLAILEATPTSATIGCAARHPGEGAESVFRRADDLLIAAKRAGKNAVRSAPLRKSA